MTPIEIFIYAIFAVITINLGLWLDRRAKRKQQRKELIMGNHNGSKLDYKQEESEKILDRAKAECEFSDRLYDLMFEYQERLGSTGNKVWSKPLNENERVGDLNLPLSRLYNQIWAAILGLNSNARSKKKDKQQMEVVT